MHKKIPRTIKLSFILIKVYETSYKKNKQNALKLHAEFIFNTRAERGRF